MKNEVTSYLINYSMGLTTKRLNHRSVRAAKTSAREGVRAAGYGWTAVVDTETTRFIRAFGSGAEWCEAFNYPANEASAVAS